MNVLVDPASAVERSSEWTTSGVGDSSKVEVVRGFEEDRLGLWTICGTSGFSTIPHHLGNHFFMFRPGTSAGNFAATEPSVLQSAVVEIRRRSQLTWEQLARVFGVQRRSLHFWARGARPSSDNAERILRVLTIVRHFDTGDAERTRAELLRPFEQGMSVYDMLCAGRDDELIGPPLGRQPSARLTRAPVRARRPPALDSAERTRRRGFAPSELLDARHGEAPSLGPVLGAVPVPGLRV